LRFICHENAVSPEQVSDEDASAWDLEDRGFLRHKQFDSAEDRNASQAHLTERGFAIE
jgi:hypothetical protein